jgi:hypothetical protein
VDAQLLGDFDETDVLDAKFDEFVMDFLGIHIWRFWILDLRFWIAGLPVVCWFGVHRTRLCGRGGRLVRLWKFHDFHNAGWHAFCTVLSHRGHICHKARTHSII